ncbi:hypothetical protein HMPREF9439_00624 [Parasutterella excrementihominis YIT 11859]|uniref:Uncharacterized protein n=1 Tax=Parasutterella excrementihominis YIT 11859 TaxID=762966 RepID=F3QI77_9BURK|nr:hypothetical protein HMPREF9439_00624 [Parasutterella excrementihominis YIT 11859]
MIYFALEAAVSYLNGWFLRSYSINAPHLLKPSKYKPCVW